MGNRDRIARRLPKGWSTVTNHCHSLIGRIWVIWNPGVVQFTVIDISLQAIHGTLTFDKAVVFVSIVYGSCDLRERRDLWANLTHHSTVAPGRPWIVLGDFDVSRYPREHTGNRLVSSKAMEEFELCIRKCEIEDLRQTGQFFTWNNKRTGAEAIAKKIDRALGNWWWFKEFSDIQAVFPPPGISDHSPCILPLQRPSIRGAGLSSTSMCGLPISPFWGWSGMYSRDSWRAPQWRLWVRSSGCSNLSLRSSTIDPSRTRPLFAPTL
ncbi:Exo_endo_phos domain-containing protein [Cephalotus follicularis]|uniref:Exo_endo_phos domain-containing protein n=1 Tax=Cephalotus follicularis TaxID=3775 RepID=A0A1Q3DK27_CEPFO|nr:Exo_endo_phos domain-containing protein [Cephalotus follicularis]